LGNKRPTRADVAKLAGVSVATVSYVVNGGPRPVSQDTKARVQAAIDALGYRPHAIARSLKTGSTKTIGLLVQSLVTTYVASLVNEVEDSLAKYDYGLILASSHEDSEREKRMFNVLASQSIDGLLYVPVSSDNGEEVTRLLSEGIPVVFVDRYIPGVPADVVMTDNVAAAREITNHMIDQGCHRILCLSFSDEASSARDRVAGYKLALEERGLPVDDGLVLVVNFASRELVGPAVLDYIDAYGLPDGILCASDDFLVRTIKALKQRSIRVPEQVLVAGSFVDSPWNALLDPPIPIVHQNFQLVARRAVEFLMDRLNGDDSPPRTELIDAKLITQH